jgi:hypothetical protein
MSKARAEFKLLHAFVIFEQVRDGNMNIVQFPFHIHLILVVWTQFIIPNIFGKKNMPYVVPTKSIVLPYSQRDSNQKSDPLKLTSYSNNLHS